MMATILNEAYLAMGFKSRHITCLPYDKDDSDCHVVTLVFSASKDKWLYMDPTFRAYFTDVGGNILSLQEIREMMIAGQELGLNSDIDWNGEPLEPDSYKHYMSKNLFRFKSPLASEFGYESREGPKSWGTLNPLGYDDEKTAEKDSSGSYYRDYYTQNANFFWPKPS